MKTALVIALIVTSSLVGFMAGRNMAAADVQAAEIKLTVAEQAVKNSNDQCRQKLEETIGALARANSNGQAIEGFKLSQSDWLQVLALIKTVLH